MGRHRTPDEKRELGEQARALRAAGRSRREIQEGLGIGDDLAKAFLRGVPLPDSLKRPRAKDELRDTAVRLRQAGCTYRQIIAELGVAKSTCSLWLRDVPVGDVVATGVPARAASDGAQEEARELRRQGVVLREIAERLGTSAKTVYYWTWDLPVPPSSRHGGDKAHMDMMRRRRWDRVLAERQHERTDVREEHAARIGAMNRRELELAAVVAYWCEGSKSKPWARRETVSFINSDPGLVLLFLAWLDDIGFPQEHRRFSISIHESADIAAAQRYWAATLDVCESCFTAPNLKRHNPRTVRKNVDEQYVGCVIVRLLQCRTLYQRIEGVWQGIMGGLPAGGDDDPSRVV